MSTAPAQLKMDGVPLWEPVPHWPQLPYGMTFGSDATAVAVDSSDRVYVYCRAEIPVLVFDRDGQYLDSWGQGEVGFSHAISVDADDQLYLTDMHHAIHVRTTEGKPIRTLGTPGRHSAPHGGEPFNVPTDVAVHPVTGEAFITDGYRNSSVHRFSPEGVHLSSYGSPGHQQGQFALPHGAAFLDSERLVVIDRENWRLQVFGVDGGTLEPISEWHAFYPQCVRTTVGTDGRTLVLVGEGPPTTYMRRAPGIGSRILVLDDTGKQLGTIGEGGWGFEANRFTAVHAIAFDSRGDLYVAEAPYATLTRFYKEEVRPGELVSIRKWRRVS